jgi:hypothetical protein
MSVDYSQDERHTSEYVARMVQTEFLEINLVESGLICYNRLNKTELGNPGCAGMLDLCGKMVG